jgi:hypothetical protein
MRLIFAGPLIAALFLSNTARSTPSAVTVMVPGERVEVSAQDDHEEWKHLCTSPCQTDVAHGAELRLKTPEGDERDVRIKAEPGERVVVDDAQLARRAHMRGAGFTLIGLGAGAMFVGAWWMLLSDVVSSLGCEPDPRDSYYGHLPPSCGGRPEPASIFTTALGGVAVVTGILLVTRAPPAFRVAPAEPLARAPEFPSRPAPRPARTTTLLRVAF